MSRISLQIERLGHHGDGIATGPDGPVYVRRALPGETVEGTVEAGRMSAPRIVVPVSERVAPPCPHARTCGGCAVQHMRDEAVEQWKEQIVRAALAAQGLTAAWRPTVTSPAFSRRRATLSGRRTRSGVQLGFHAAASDTIVDNPKCRLLRPELLSLRPALSDLVRLGSSRKGEISLTVTVMLNGVDVEATGGREPDPALLAELAGLAAAAGIVRLTWNGELVAQTSTPVIAFDGIRVAPPPGAFLQATADGETALRRAVLDAVEGSNRVADLFAGCGTFSLPLARSAEVGAWEGDPALAEALRGGWRNAQGLKAVTVAARDLFRRPLDPAELAPFDAVVIDPPRAGASAQVAQIVASAVSRLAMVSCNPITFARDAKQLTDAGWLLDWVQVVDQFRWSSHVELVAAFRSGESRSQPALHPCSS